MLQALQEDTDILFYNVFGAVDVQSAEEMTVTAYFMRRGIAYPVSNKRELHKELSKPLVHFAAPLIVPFGAWVDQDDIHVAVPELTGYDDQFLKMNIKAIVKQIKEVVATLKGSINS